MAEIRAQRLPAAEIMAELAGAWGAMMARGPLPPEALAELYREPKQVQDRAREDAA